MPAEPKEPSQTQNEVAKARNDRMHSVDQATFVGEDDPPVDTSHAAALNVSRLRGRSLKLAIGVVAGTGVR